MVRKSIRRLAGARARHWLGAAAAVAALAACTEGGRSEYADDGDTGAAAPATSPDQSTARMIGPDSGPSPENRTGRPGMAGDTLGARGTPAGASDSATRAAVDSATRTPTRPPV